MKFLLISWCPRGALWYLRVCGFTVQGLWSSSVQNCVSLGVAVCDPNCNKRNNRLFGNEQLRSEDFKGASHSHLHVIVKSSCFPIMVREPTWDSLVGCSNTFCLLLFFMDYSHQSIEWFIPACKDIKAWCPYLLFVLFHLSFAFALSLLVSLLSFSFCPKRSRTSKFWLWFGHNYRKQLLIMV